MLHHRAHTQSLRHVGLLATPRTVARQAPLSMGLLRQEYWSGLTFSPSGDLLEPGIEAMSPESLASAGRLFPTLYGSSLFNFLRKLHLLTLMAIPNNIPTEVYNGFLLSKFLPALVTSCLFFCLFDYLLTC